MTIINGLVNDENGQPVAGASVYFVSAPVSMPDIAQLTDSKGIFRVSVPAKGRYVIGVKAADWGMKEVTLVVKDETNMHVHIQYTQKQKQ